MTGTVRAALRRRYRTAPDSAGGTGWTVRSGNVRIRPRRFAVFGGWFSHPTLSDAGCAIGTYGVPFRVQASPLGLLLVLDRAYVAAIYASFPIPAGARLRLSITELRTSQDRDTNGVYTLWTRRSASILHQRCESATP